MLQSAPLAAGEDEQDYAALVCAFHDAVEPKNIFDQMRVADLAHTRGRKGVTQTAGCTAACYAVQGCCVLLMPFTKKLRVQAGKVAQDYLCGDPEARERARRIMPGTHYRCCNRCAGRGVHTQSIAALDRLVAQSRPAAPPL